jgi:hypothetical protein
MAVHDRARAGQTGALGAAICGHICRASQQICADSVPSLRRPPRNPRIADSAGQRIARMPALAGTELSLRDAAVLGPPVPTVVAATLNDLLDEVLNTREGAVGVVAIGASRTRSQITMQP